MPIRSLEQNISKDQEVIHSEGLRIYQLYKTHLLDLELVKESPLLGRQPLHHPRVDLDVDEEPEQPQHPDHAQEDVEVLHEK